MLQDQQGKWMKVTNMKVAVEDNHVETMAGYKLAAEDTLTSTFEFRV
jgi:lipocalin